MDLLSRYSCRGSSTLPASTPTICRTSLDSSKLRLSSTCTARIDLMCMNGRCYLPIFALQRHAHDYQDSSPDIPQSVEKSFYVAGEPSHHTCRQAKTRPTTQPIGSRG